MPVVQFPPQKADWLKLCIYEGKKPIPNVANAIIALENTDYKDAFAYDEMMLMPTLRQSSPLAVSDDDATKVQEWMQHSGLKHIGIRIVEQAIEHVSRKNPFHPIRQYLDALQWDGETRINGAAIEYLGCEDTAYNRSVFEMFMIQMVARVLQPGCKADYMLVLEGPQGVLKSSFCKTLAGDDYFSDDLPEKLHDKDTKIHLRGKWLIEVAEMHAFTKQEATALKSFLTRTNERYRLPYGHFETLQPRQCVFIGTTNKDAYLRDDTGGRRFWPIKCGRIDIGALAADRDQLFAEAVFAFREGRHWWPDAAFERDHIKPQQDARFEDDAWLGPVAEFLAGQTETSLEAVAKSALSLDVSKLDMASQKRIGSILQQLGWAKKNAKRAGVIVKRWFRIERLL
jgi:predicted P-loop ATPase